MKTIIELAKETNATKVGLILDNFEIQAYWVDGRVDDSDVPVNACKYEIRGNDNDPGLPTTLERKVSVNFVATLLLPIPISEIESGVPGYIDIADRINFAAEWYDFYETC